MAMYEGLRLEDRGQGTDSWIELLDRKKGVDDGVLDVVMKRCIDETKDHWGWFWIQP